MNTGDQIKDLRTQSGLTQEDLAEKTGLSARTIQRIESGNAEPRVKTLKLIASALEVDFAVFESSEVSGNSHISHDGAGHWLAVLYMSGALPLFFPSILIWRSKKDELKIHAKHYRNVLGFQLKVLGAVLASLWVYWKMHMSIPVLGVLLASVLFSIVMAVRALNE